MDNRNEKAYNPYSLLRNILVVVISLLGMGGSLLLFRQDLDRTMLQLEEKPAGAVFWVSKTAQRTSARYARPDRVVRYLPIYSGDLISTAPLSSVKMSFVSGEILEVLENSTVRVLFGEQVPSIELTEGEIQIQCGRGKVLISARAVNINLESGTIAGVMARDDYSIKIFQGQGSVSSGGILRQAAEGTSIGIGKDGIFSPDPPIMMLSPRNGTRILRTGQGNEKVQFHWQRGETSENDPANSAILLEISETGDFSGLVGSIYSETDDSAEIELQEGPYYWRIFNLPDNEAVDSGRFEIINVQPPQAISPADKSVQTIRPPVTGAAGAGDRNRELHFAWSVPEDAESVLLEVASNPEMNRPRIRQLIKRNRSGIGSYISSGLEPGQWYWRVHPVYPGSITEGEGQSFFRVRASNVDIIAEDEPSPVNSFILSEAAESVPEQTRTYTAFSGGEPGENPRIVFPADNFSLDSGRTPDLFFSWKNPVSFEAKLQIAERSDFSGELVMNEKVFGSNIQSSFLEPGTYYWRVTGAGPEGPGETEPVRLVVTPSLRSPSLESPKENERLIIEEGKAVNFNWERVNYANYYEFRLYVEGRDVPLTQISSLRTNSILVYFDPGTNGRFIWTVQGFTSPTDISNSRAGLIAQGQFTVSSQRNFSPGSEMSWTVPRIANVQTYSGTVRSPITLLSPALGVNIPGLQALRSPVMASWRSDVPLRNIQLIVSSTQDPLSDPKAIVRDASASFVSFPSLSAGIWYWIIRGDTIDERGVSPGDPFWINVLPVPILPQPEYIQPENEVVIGIAQLTRDRNITFSWGEVEGANAYIFSLFRNIGTPVLLYASDPGTERSYVLNNLSILNSGGYLWQVEAVYLGPNSIEQRGKIVQHSFTIEIQRSGNLQTQGQGTMYGQ